MSMIPAGLRYTKEHEWAQLENDGTVKIGITDHAQHELGDVVFVDLPKIGLEFSAGDEFGLIESVKAVGAIYCPISGKVVARNEDLDSEPELVNTEPYSAWLISILPNSVADLDGLMDSTAYAEYLKEPD
ncbi:MAG: glycine cleavage system protein GcvH [Gammaproteobacteria bacterium]